MSEANSTPNVQSDDGNRGCLTPISWTLFGVLFTLHCTSWHVSWWIVLLPLIWPAIIYGYGVVRVIQEIWKGNELP